MTRHDLLRTAARAVPRPARRRARWLVTRARAQVDIRRPPRWGNLRRHRPFSERYGFDRGTPVDRVYLDRFFAAHGGDIRGAVLEVKDAAFTSRHGTGVATVDLLDIDSANVDATVIADLAEPGSLPSAAYDCIVVPQTFQYVTDPAAAMANAWSALRPGGVLLVSAPSVAPLDPHLGHLDRWRFTPSGLGELATAACGGGEISVHAYGNLVATIAFLHGLAAEELRSADLDHIDDRYPLLACVRVRRPA